MAPACHRTCTGLVLLSVILWPAHGILSSTALKPSNRPASKRLVFPASADVADLDPLLSSSAEVSALAAKVLSLRQAPWDLAQSKKDLEEIREGFRDRLLQLQTDYANKQHECREPSLFSDSEQTAKVKCEELEEIRKKRDATQELINHLSDAIAAWPSS